MRGLAIALALLSSGCHLLLELGTSRTDAGPGDAHATEQAPPPGCDPRLRPCVIQQLALGWNHSCLLADAGAVWCWGEDGFGQLGDDGTVDVPAPKRVAISDRIQLIAAGGGHTCAAGERGTWCWGNNEMGQLGLSPVSVRRSPPILVPGLGMARLLALGERHSCGLFADGKLRCWGSGEDGRLAGKPGPGPVDLTGLGGTVDLSCGEGHCCAVLAAGSVVCWGRNEAGQTGQAASTYPVAPTTLGELAGVSNIACGQRHCCARHADGTVTCWGSNGVGQLGQPEVMMGRLSFPGKVLQLAAGGLHACAVLEGGGLRCWGYDRYGQLGLGEGREQSSTPTVVPLAPVVEVKAGDLHTCAYGREPGKPDRLWCWGASSQGQIGNGVLLRRAVPQIIPGLRASSITSGGNHSCALRAGGSAACWGHNAQGQVGLTDVANKATPTTTPSGSAFLQIRGGALHTTAIEPGLQAIWGWGASWAKQLGPTSSQVFAPQKLTGLNLTAVGDLANGHNHSCALLSGLQQVVCWGSNLAGQLGNGTTTSSAMPVVALLAGASKIAAQQQTTCAIHLGVVKCWGLNDDGQLGDGTTTNRSSPVVVAGVPAPATAVGVGGYHACAVSSGKVYCWGANWSGQLGNGSSASSKTPVLVTGPSGVTEVSCGLKHTCALTGLEVHCWGSNETEQLGASGPSQRSPILALRDATAVAAGWFHTCALSSSGEVLCWGDQTFGQLGDGVSSKSTTPQLIYPPQ